MAVTSCHDKCAPERRTFRVQRRPGLGRHGMKTLELVVLGHVELTEEWGEYQHGLVTPRRVSLQLARFACRVHSRGKATTLTTTYAPENDAARAESPGN